MKTTFVLFLIFPVLGSCQFSKSVKKDLVSELSSTGSIISCADVYITVDDEKTTRNSFIYGETFYLNFSDVTGLTKENGTVFPGMNMSVINASGDTLMKTGDLISNYPDGMNFTPLLLTADLTVAAPIKSGGKYTVVINIRDRKGKGIYSSKFDFTVIKNDRITVESSNVAYDEIYLFSPGNDKVITDNKIAFNDNIYVIIEGLKGFAESGGTVFPGMRVKATDSANNIILESDDIFSDYTVSGFAASDLAERVSAHFSIPGTQFNNPLHIEMTVWDKKSNARIKASADLILE